MWTWRHMARNRLIHRGIPETDWQGALRLTILIVMSLLTSCQERYPSQTGSVQLKGSETLRPLLTMCAEDFMTRRPHIDVMVQGGGSGTGIAALLHGTADIGMASRELSEKEHQYADKQGLKIRAFDVALDGIAVVVHPHNPAEILTLADIEQPYPAEI
jgi:ABC-type phosphate transport system substrate-binding protein